MNKSPDGGSVAKES